MLPRIVTRVWTAGHRPQQARVVIARAQCWNHCPVHVRRLFAGKPAESKLALLRSQSQMLTAKIKDSGKKLKEDKGLFVMNLGAILSLTGFMMSDVLYLRLLSVCGSFCGMTYNLTRVPKQLNAVAWGSVFAFVNIVQIVRLLLERSEINFTEEEMGMYANHFADFGVASTDFYQLMQIGNWKHVKAGDKLVEAGQQLSKVIMVHSGAADVVSPDNPTKIKWTYNGGVAASCVIGGTALVDKNVTKRRKGYPHDIVATEDTSYVEWPLDKLAKHCEEHHQVHASIFSVLHKSLVQHLRKNRQAMFEDEHATNMEKYKLIVRMALTDGQVDEDERQMANDVRRKYRITDVEHKEILGEMGWTPSDYLRGCLVDLEEDLA